MPMPTPRPTNLNEATAATVNAAISSVNQGQLYGGSGSEDEYTRLSSFEICFQAQELVQDLVQKVF